MKLGVAVSALAVVVAVGLIVLTGGDSTAPTDQQSGAAAPATWTAGEFSGGPRLAVDRATYDQGAVGYGEAVHAAFQLRNVGDEPLTLGEMSVNTLEGC
ncbi:MAG TPA: hypothetical protein VFV93_05560 [Thermomicrobiales bacterium]|nr:hypothetical protein [Thermomicrobiales bacterium]